VWAYHPDKRAMAPPTNGWKVPYDGDVDKTFKIEPTGRNGGSHSSANPGHHPEDERRRQDQQRRDAKKRKADEENRRVEEEKRKAEAEKKRLEDIKRKEEEEQRKKEEEVKRKKDMEEKRRLEQKSSLAIRRVIQKVRQATPDNFDELQKELQEVLSQELENCCTQKDRMKEESDKGVEQARKRIEQLNEQRKREQDKKDAEEKKRIEADERAKGLIKELESLVESAEGKARELKEMAATLEEGAISTLEDVEKVARMVEEAGAESKELTKECTDFILQKGPEMKESTPPNASGTTAQPSEMKQTLAKLLQRITDCTKLSESNVQAARGAKEKAVRRAAAREKTRELEATFDKYDKDSDDVLSKKEVIAYAKGEFKFVLPEDTIDLVFRNVVEEGSKGVTMGRFQLLKAAVGVARERTRDRKRKAERAQKENVLKDKKADLLKRIKEASLAVDVADKAVSVSEEQVKPFMAKAKTMPAPEMLALADDTDQTIKDAKESTQAARDEIDGLSEGFERKFEDDLKAYLNQEAKQLELRMGRLGARLSRASNLSARFREQAVRKTAAELERMKAIAFKVVIFNQKLNNLTGDLMFAFIDTDRDGEISEQEFIEFFTNADREIREVKVDLPIHITDDAEVEGAAVEDKISRPTVANLSMPAEEEKVALTEEGIARLFLHLLEIGETGMTRQLFSRLCRVYMKVVKETVLTASFSIKNSRTLRRLEVNEVIEILDGPFREDNIDVRRCRARVMKDGLEGWVTVTGNQGTVFLKDGGNCFKVVKETFITEDFEIDAEQDESTLKPADRKLREDEVLEVYEWPKLDEKSGSMRMKGRVRSDGTVGWVSMIGSTGITYLEVI